MHETILKELGTSAHLNPRVCHIYTPGHATQGQGHNFMFGLKCLCIKSFGINFYLSLKSQVHALCSWPVSQFESHFLFLSDPYFLSLNLKDFSKDCVGHSWWGGGGCMV